MIEYRTVCSIIILAVLSGPWTADAVRNPDCDSVPVDRFCFDVLEGPRPDGYQNQIIDVWEDTSWNESAQTGNGTWVWRTRIVERQSIGGIDIQPLPGTLGNTYIIDCGSDGFCSIWMLSRFGMFYWAGGFMGGGAAWNGLYYVFIL